MKYLIILLATLCSCNNTPAPYKYSGYETDDTSYVKGQVLPPDQIHDNALIVVNADSLNWSLRYENSESDADLIRVLNKYCKPINQPLNKKENVRSN